MSAIGEAIEALVAQIAAVNGSGSYTYDLRTTDAVVFGLSSAPPTNPHVAVAPYIEGQGEPGVTLTEYRHQWQLAIVGRVSATTDNELARFQAAANLYADVLRGIAVDRTLGGYARDVLPSAPEIGATHAGVIPGYGWFILPVTIDVVNGNGA